MSTSSSPTLDPAMPRSGPIRDTHGRAFDYLRIALIEQCNLRCVYCMPEVGMKFAPHHDLLTTDEVLRMVRVAASAGVSKIRFTGGEPLIRKDLVELVRETRATTGITSVHLTTNGLLFDPLAEPLRAAGLDGVNVSLDTLDPEKFARITRRAGVEKVRAAIDRAVKLGFPSVKVNVVALRDFNHDEIPAFVELTREAPITVRFIELMPFDAHQIWKTGRFFGTDWIRKALEEIEPGVAGAEGSKTEATVVRFAAHRGKVAIIPAYTRSLCGACNRIRLTADGKIRNCLYSRREFDLRSLLRGGASDETIQETLRAAVWKKLPTGWDAQREEIGTSNGDGSNRISMTQIGG
jgi:cyclic pyranopterin phosphate synthase